MTEVRGVVSDWTAVYADPITLAAGDTLTVVKGDLEWPEFVWCVAADGREGWVPRSFVDATVVPARARRAYDARELTVRVGDAVRVLESIGGWSWCALGNRSGWIPDRSLAPAGTPDIIGP